MGKFDYENPDEVEVTLFNISADDEADKAMVEGEPTPEGVVYALPPAQLPPAPNVIDEGLERLDG